MPTCFSSSITGMVHILTGRAPGFKSWVSTFIYSLGQLLANQEATSCWTLIHKTSYHYSLCWHPLVLQLYRRERTVLGTFKILPNLPKGGLRYH